MATNSVNLPQCLLENGPQYLRRLNWRKLQVPESEMMPYFTLVSGQCFNWHRLNSSNVWVGVVGEHPLALSQTKDGVMYAPLLNDDYSGKSLEPLLQSYLQLDISITDLYLQV